MTALVLTPLVLQALVMIGDELYFHRRRGLPRWERVGHPLDTLTLVGCLGWLLASSPGDRVALGVYAGLAIASTLFVTKDEPVHARLCDGGEQWLHAVLFALHPVVLAALGLAWWHGHTTLVAAQLVLTLAFLGYQVVYWNVVVPRRERRPARPRAIDNDWYAELGERWYTASDTPIALLRAESRHRNPWIAAELARHAGGTPCRVLDLGCGAGFLTNHLAAHDHVVTGLDTTAENLAVARRYDRAGTATYVRGDACALPFADASFDVVCAMDLLEHVDQPGLLIAEASRVLRPGGLFVFHTFNRNWLANLVVIKGVEWFVKNTPADLHVLRLFIRPDELAALLARHGLAPVELRGVRPRLTWPFWRMLLTREVGEDFAFTFTGSTTIGYTGVARRAMIEVDATGPRSVQSDAGGGVRAAGVRHDDQRDLVGRGRER